MKNRASFSVLYFVVGFLAVAILSMLLLILARPLLGAQPGMLVRRLAMLAPLILGVPFGLRVAWVGMKYDLKLGTALKRAFSFGAPDTTHPPE